MPDSQRPTDKAPITSYCTCGAITTVEPGGIWAPKKVTSHREQGREIPCPGGRGINA